MNQNQIGKIASPERLHNPALSRPRQSSRDRFATFVGIDHVGDGTVTYLDYTTA